MPSEPPESDFKDRLTIKAYPTYEVGGLVWIYMGPPEQTASTAAVARMDRAAPSPSPCVKWFHENNYMQGIEGDIDTAHVSFLHSDNRPEQALSSASHRAAHPQLFRLADRHPRLTAMDTDYGMVYGGRRLCRTAQLLLARDAVAAAQFLADSRPRSTRWHRLDPCRRRALRPLLDWLTPDQDMDMARTRHAGPAGSRSSSR